MLAPSIGGIIESIKDGTALGVNNGSFTCEFGTTCWMIENGSGTERIVGLIDVPGFNDEHDAYKSELAGLYGIVKVVEMLEK